MDYVLQTKNLCKKFRQQLAVKNVSINIKKGDIYGLIGQNGAGKTTFMRLICGLARETSGSIRLFSGENIVADRKKMGATIENPALYAEMTALENMEVYCRFLGIKNKEKPKELLEFVGLLLAGTKKAKNFSLGMKQRLMIAIALLGDPEFLILDEPMNGLDPMGIKEIRDLLLKLNRQKGLTILVSSHILDELSKIATRYGILSAGKLIEEFSAEHLFSNNNTYVLRTDDLSQTADLIYSHFVSKVTLLEDELVICEKQNEIPQIMRLLAKNNINVHALIPQEQNLEEYYMGKIGGQIS